MKNLNDMKQGDDVSLTFDGKLEGVHHIIKSSEGIQSETHDFVLDSKGATIYLNVHIVPK